MNVAAGKMEHGATDSKIEGSRGKRHILYAADPKVVQRIAGRQLLRPLSDGRYGSCILVYSKNIVAIVQEVHYVSPVTTAHIYHVPAVIKPALEQLIKQIDIYIPKGCQQIMVHTLSA
jgi:hypothetical protein